MQVKFRQIEETKTACRNMIAYAKFYMPLDIHKIISDNFN